VLLVLGLLSCASGNRPAALGWSLGGEAHVFVTGDRFARDLYRDLTGSGRLADSLGRRPRVSVAPRKAHRATVLSANGATPARLTLARFHAAETCGYPGIAARLCSVKSRERQPSWSRAVCRQHRRAVGFPWRDRDAWPPPQRVCKTSAAGKVAIEVARETIARDEDVGFAAEAPTQRSRPIAGGARQ